MTKYGPDILSKFPDSVQYRTKHGIYLPQLDENGNVSDVYDYDYILSEHQVKNFRAPKKIYTRYTSYYYKNKSGNFIRTEYYLPNDMLLYRGDCVDGNEMCIQRQLDEIVVLLNKYLPMFVKRGATVISIERKKSKKCKRPKRVVKKCKCKKK